MNTHSLAKASLVLGAGFIVFLFIKPRARKKLSINATSVKEEDPIERSFIPEPTLDKKHMKNVRVANAFKALKAYIKAYNNKEPQSRLDELNKEIGKTLGMTVERRRSDNKLIVKDLNGKTLIENRSK